MSGEATGALIEPLDDQTLLERLTAAFAKANISYELPEPARHQLVAVAQAHQNRCERPGRLSWEAARLVTDIVEAELLEPADIEVLVTAVVLDKLMALNDSKLEWYEPESYPLALDSVRAGNGPEPLARWIDSHRTHRRRGVKVVVILGAMTTHDTNELGAVRHRARQLKRLFESLGFRVHAPCASPASRRPVGDAADEDIVQVSIADMVVVLPDPIALGVGILLGEAARRHSPTLFVTEATTDLTPITSIVASIVGDLDDDLVTFITDEELLEKVKERVLSDLADIERRHTKHLQRLAQKAEMFEEYRDSYKFAKSTGISINVPDIRQYRVRLICTRIEVFATATLDELTDISEAINEALDGPPVVDPRVVSDITELRESGRLESAGVGDAGFTQAQTDPHMSQAKTAAHDAASDDEFREEDGIGAPNEEQFDQPALFTGYTRHVDSGFLGVADDGREWLTPYELLMSESARTFLNLSEADNAYMLKEARATREMEAQSFDLVSKVELGTAPAWVEFWRKNLGRG